MLQHYDPIPFTIDRESHLGMSEVQGLISSDGLNLVIEYRTVDTVFGLLKSGLEEIAIPFADIRSFRFEKKYMGLSASILLRTRSQQAIQDLPESQHGEVTFTIRRRDRNAAERFCLAVTELLVHERNRRLTDDIDRLELEE